MTSVSDLVFLGPAIGAVITSVYALRAARHSTAMQLHTSYADKRLDIVNELLDATEECRRAGTDQEQREAGRKLHPAVLRVRLALNSDHDLVMAADATAQHARVVMECPRPAQLRDRAALTALRDRAAYDGRDSAAEQAWNFVNSGGRPDFTPFGINGPSTAYCSSVRSPRPMNRDHPQPKIHFRHTA